MDPVGPFIDYLLDRGEVAAAIGLAVIVAAAMLGAVLIRARARRRRGASIQSKGEGNVQTTVVSNVRSKGDVTISPQQKQ